MKRIAALGMVLILLFATSAFASSIGAVSTDRFGYTGTVYRYASLEDAQNNTNVVDTITVGNRDLSVYSSAGTESFMGSWWYTTDPSGNDGYGNTRGNSGVGFIQMYDDGLSSVQSRDYSFGGYDGTYYTEFTAQIAGSGADYDNEYARLWTEYTGSGSDIGVFLDYNLQFTASGLEGVLSGNLIEANDHPDSVLGSLQGIFENTSTSDPSQNGYYVFDFALDMENWAYSVRDELTGYPFDDSYFAAAAPVQAVPEPSTFALMGAALVGFFAMRRRFVR